MSGSSLNVFELDAASNSSVVDVRELIEQARYATASAWYRIFIIQSEEIKVSDAALNVIVSYAKGGMRDAISLLQQVSLFDEIDETRVCDLLGIVPEDAIEEIIDL